MTEAKRVYIHAAAALTAHGASTADERSVLSNDADTDMKDLSKRVLGQRLRQASHFVELATIGARLCLNRLGETERPDMAVYLGTALGDTRKNEALFSQVFPPGTGIAAPFDFINATSNMAAFYVARLAGTSARNLTVTQGIFSFERALQLAFDDLRAGDIATALVGGVDENCFPRATYKLHWPLRDHEIMGEGSAWLFLSTESEGAIAELLTLRQWREALEPSQLAQAIQALGPAAAIICGNQLSAADRSALAQTFPRAPLLSYQEYCGSYPTAAGFGVASQLEDKPAPGLRVHVNRDVDGSAMLVGWKV
jgi:3-oxoacyl-[acyl-carrier-protein] synthase II